MENVIVKFFKGWMNSANMNNPNWINHWSINAKEAENEACQLVVFKIPNGKNSNQADSQTIEEIEVLLQEKYSTVKS